MFVIELCIDIVREAHLSLNSEQQSQDRSVNKWWVIGSVERMRALNNADSARDRHGRVSVMCAHTRLARNRTIFTRIIVILIP